jgi:anti-sigma regulatory factor (Ser/Thr protein kinase)
MTSLVPRDSDVALFVRFPPKWAHIEPLRQYIDLAARGRGYNGTADKLNIVAQELLENAVKYGDPGSDVELELRIDPGKGVEIRVSNKAHRSRVVLLQKEFQRVQSESAKEAFTKALQRLQRLPDGATMLGLARMAMEANVNLEVSGDIVIVTARVAR